MANYPTSVSTDANIYVAVNNGSTTLNGALTASGDNTGGTGILVASAAGFPTTGFITIDSEAISYTNISGGNKFTGTTRGVDGTTATSHTNGASVGHDVMAAHHNVLKEEIKAMESDLINGMSIPINMNSHKITNLTNGSAASDAAAFGQIPTTPISVANGGTGDATGKGLILQILTASTTSDLTTTSGTYSDITGLSQAITPTYSGSKIRCRASLNLASEPAANGTCNVSVQLLKDGISLQDFGTVFRVSSTTGGTLITIGQVTLEFDDSPGNTSSHTYKLQWKVSAGTGELNAVSGTSFLKVEEIGQ